MSSNSKALYIAVGYTDRQDSSLFIITTAETQKEADTAVLNQIRQGTAVKGKTVKMTVSN